MHYSPAPMHIPDGFLSLFVAILYWIPSLLVISIALRHTGKELGERQVPLMGILAATIFAAQMLNFTVAGGTSGHLLGATLATILLGPWAAVLVMTSVVFVQALIFQDGGLLALGANLFNMAVVGVFVSYVVYQVFQKLAHGRRWGTMLGGFTAAWLAIVVSALSVGLQLALSDTSPANLAIPAMAGIHAIIGIGEGMITLGALSFLSIVRGNILHQSPKTSPAGNTGLWIGGILITFSLAVLSPFASTHPDGLEWVAEQQGFLNQAVAPALKVLPDYLVPGVTNQAIATILAAIIGAAIVLSVTILASRVRRPFTNEQ